MAKVKPKIPEKRGRGRPAGSKSKATYDDAIKLLECNMIEAATLMVGIMQGEHDANVNQRMKAAEFVIKAPHTLKKGQRDDGQEVDDESFIPTAPVPLVSLSIVEV